MTTYSASFSPCGTTPSMIQKNTLPPCLAASSMLGAARMIADSMT